MSKKNTGRESPSWSFASAGRAGFPTGAGGGGSSGDDGFGGGGSCVMVVMEGCQGQGLRCGLSKHTARGGKGTIFRVQYVYTYRTIIRKILQNRHSKSAVVTGGHA